VEPILQSEPDSQQKKFLSGVNVALAGVNILTAIVTAISFYLQLPRFNSWIESLGAVKLSFGVITLFVINNETAMFSMLLLLPCACAMMTAGWDDRKGTLLLNIVCLRIILAALLAWSTVVFCSAMDILEGIPRRR
jgi:hypothetical protein